MVSHERTIVQLTTAIHFLDSARPWHMWVFVGIMYGALFAVLGTIYEVDSLRQASHYTFGLCIGTSIGLSCISFANRRLLKKIYNETD